MKELVGAREQRDIEQLVAKILRDLGNPEPPLHLGQVRDLLSLDLKYYSTTDVGPLAEISHRLKVAGKQLVERPGLLLDVVKKAKLSGLWLPDDRRIFIDSELPPPKHRWIEAHEITHSFVPWHREFLLGDDELTLDPACHAVIEAEANFGAGRLIFFGNKFAGDARDCDPTFKSIKRLQGHYGNTLTSTFWRFVEDRDAEVPAFGLISRHPHYADIGSSSSGDPVHRFVASTAFHARFPDIKPLDVYTLVARNASWSRKGPVVDGIDTLTDATGAPVRFVLDGFCNSYQVLTYGRCV
ncbi:hypothetical protein M0D68_23190 [Paraburkholderia sp. SEWSISQ10-3 4]|uniref:ImmA/IrrE family metallo-endopeptidase n=1 Tax=Paraburkholderia TaxID=1822464 RepID=UPI00225B2D85|nr:MULTISPECIES: hypothetical protein [Paraburkholderia]MCX4141117.1 hypothetical protein [Paraburkholderia aspalathi]MDN7173800.1 hypothetical protein [Paraburkholderia sp. SEWSISQ10-3 4]MDQ6503441.1 hypothetical protein [Paraburkholderia aspalathi]